MRRQHLALTLLMLSACAAPLRRFPLAPPLRVDDDMQPVAHVAPYRSSDASDFVDQTLFRPALDATGVRLEREAINVNAFDEVPDSSWYTNRLGARAVTTDEVAEGSCTTPPIDASQRWWIVSAKQNGFNPGFVILAPDGHRYVLKADGVRQTQLATAADAIAARIYHVLGYNTPCNRVVYFEGSILAISPGTHSADDQGQPRPINADVIDRVLRQATRLPDGRYRMSASRYIDGEPLGPFTYQGLRTDDANDVVPHEDRRELRGSRLIAAWLNHYDTREQNTLTTWVAVPGGGYVKHYLLDFGDAFGAAWPWDPLTARSGHAYAADFAQIGEDFLTFGSIVRPWDRSHIDADAWVFTYFNGDDFDPGGWRPITPNPAFVRMTERDAAWIARQIARLDRPMLHAAIASGEITHPEWNNYLEQTLAIRRERILARYLTRRSPLTDVRVDGDHVCAVDLARVAGLHGDREYAATVYAGAHRTRIVAASTTNTNVCTAAIPREASLGDLPDDDRRRYLVIDITGAADGDAPLRVHLYDLDARGLRVVGLERPDHASAPGI